MTGDKWVKMTADEYMEYRRGRVANETAYREGYGQGIRGRLKPPAQVSRGCGDGER